MKSSPYLEKLLSLRTSKTLLPVSVTVSSLVPDTNEKYVICESE